MVGESKASASLMQKRSYEAGGQCLTGELASAKLEMSIAGAHIDDRATAAAPR